jgi:hypothetical protein
MKKKFLTFLLSLAGSVLLLSVAEAHHGWGGYKDRVEGVFKIVQVKLGNPHDCAIAGLASTRIVSASATQSKSSDNGTRSDWK